jgi:carbonic anhydrase/acetyltransferase-like protein (isoleucine patch superfamily)
MPQVETLPQSLAKTRQIVLKPRLDQIDIQLIGDKIKPRLFSRFGFNSKSENIQLLYTETYFEPYLIISGEYVLDYCRKHTFRLNVKGNAGRIFVGGQEYRSEKTEKFEPNSDNKTFKIVGESYARYERQAYYILDRMMTEIPPEKLPLSPFDIKINKLDRRFNFKKFEISDEAQIEFLKQKIVQRPANLAEIIKETFDITDRTIAYYPMYQLTFENLKNKESAIVTINGISGEIILNFTKKLAVKTIIEFSPRTKKQLTEKTIQKAPRTKKQLTEKTIQKAPRTKKQLTEPDTEENITLGFPAKLSGETFTVGDNVTAIIGDMNVPSGTYINKTLVVKGILVIGNNCKVHGNLKVLKDVTIGDGTIIDGNLVSGGNIVVGSHALITGSIQAAGHIKMGEHSSIERGLRTNSKDKTRSDIKLEIGIPDTQEELSTVVWET